MKTVVIGIGNAYRGDDAVGLHVARKLSGLRLPDVAVRECSGDTASLAETWRGAQKAILVDAMCSGSMPASIHRFNASAQPLPREEFPAFSTHAFDLASCIELFRNLQQLPPALVVYGIEGTCFKNGRWVSRAMEQAISQTVSLICDEILNGNNG